MSITYTKKDGNQYSMTDLPYNEADVSTGNIFFAIAKNYKSGKINDSLIVPDINDLSHELDSTSWISNFKFNVDPNNSRYIYISFHVSQYDGIIGSARGAETKIYYKNDKNNYLIFEVNQNVKKANNPTEKQYIWKSYCGGDNLQTIDVLNVSLGSTFVKNAHNTQTFYDIKLVDQNNNQISSNSDEFNINGELSTVLKVNNNFYLYYLNDSDISSSKTITDKILYDNGGVLYSSLNIKYNVIEPFLVFVLTYYRNNAPIDLYSQYRNVDGHVIDDDFNIDNQKLMYSNGVTQSDNVLDSDVISMINDSYFNLKYNDTNNMICGVYLLTQMMDTIHDNRYSKVIELVSLETDEDLNGFGVLQQFVELSVEKKTCTYNNILMPYVLYTNLP